MGREKGYKTRQQAAILDFLIQNRDKHVSVYDIANHIKTAGGTIGVTTVYRHIDSLMEDGIVQKYTLEGAGGALYQYVGDEACHKHFHLKCERCGKLVHMECSQMEDIYHHVLSDHEFQINSQKTVFYGLCDSCRGADESRGPSE